MASRALGAFFALAAAAAIVVSIASSAWWAGPPVVEGREMAAKYVHAGPLGATGCNVGGDGKCEPVSIEQTVQLVGYGALGAAALATLFLFVLLSAALRVSDHRRGVATTSLLFTLLAAGGAGALLYLGPGIEASQHVDVPIGWGAYAFGGGMVASLLASLITRRLEPEPLRLKPSLAQVQAPVDVREALREQHDQLRPAALGPEPKLGTPRPEVPQRASNPLIEGAPQLRPLYDPQAAGVVPAAHAPTIPVTPPTPLARDAIGQLMGRTPPPIAAPPSQPSYELPRTPSGSPRMGPSTPALSNRAQAGPSTAAASSRTQAGSSPRIRPPDDEQVNPFARTKPPTEPPNARPRSPSSPPPRPSQPGLTPPRTKPASDAPPLHPSGSSVGSSSGSPLPGMPPMRAKPATDAPPGMPPMRGKPTTDAPPPPVRGKPATDAPPPPVRGKPTTDAPPPVRGKPTTDAPREKPSTDPPPTQGAPARPSAPGIGAGDARAKPPTLSPVRTVVPSPAPGLRGKAIVVPEHMRASTEQGTPPPADPKPQRGSRPGITPPPSLHNKTLAHAVPPMPSIDEPASRRAQTEDDDSLEAAMRETDYITAVEIDHEAKAAAAAAADAGNAKHLGLSKHALDQMGEDTAVGLLAAPPSPPLRPGDDSEFNRAGSQAERTGRTQLPEARPAADDLMKTMEQNPKTPIPTIERPSQTPIPVVEAERRTQVPITTAPTTLPPPKSLDAVPSGPTPACPQCESPMNWVDEHLRFYCKSCRMYF